MVADPRRLEELLATLAVDPGAKRDALDATLRRGELRPREAGAREAATSSGGERAPTTAPFLPSITLGEAGSGDPSALPSADLLVEALLGEGGMGVVHGAAQRSLGRAVAIKRPLSGASGALLIDEARTMAHVEHPNVVPVHALGRDGSGQPVLVMKRVAGASFRELLRRADHPSWPMLEARWGDRRSASLGILADVADALGHAHARGIIHRDVKPENVMVGESGEVYLLDWGIALKVGEPVDAGDGIVGTPGFMAPEMVIEPDRCDARTDVYLLGATLHQILTGTLRHVGDSLAATLGAAIESAPVVYDDDVPADLAALANASTSVDRAARPESAAAFRRALLDHERHKEALGLVHAAREALARLREGTLGAGEPEAATVLFEARSLLAAAVRAHPTCPLADAPRAECLALSIERELALESPAAARALLAQLPSPRADLADRVTALEQRIARAKASDAELERARAEADTSRAVRTRMMVQAAAFVPMVLIAVAVPLVGRGGPALSMHTIAWTNLGVLVLLGVGVFFARGRLLENRGNRVLTWYAIGALAVTVLTAFVADTLGIATSHGLAFIHVVVATYTIAGALTLEPALVAVVVNGLVFAALFVAWPEATPVLSPLGVLGTIVTGLGAVYAHASSKARR